MKTGQEQIYYLAGENIEQVENSPLIERLIKKGYEVLYMTDAIDEYALGHLEKYDGKYKLTNIGREGLKFDGEEDNGDKEKVEQEEYSGLLAFLKTALVGKIEKAVISNRLTTSPSALTTGQYGWTANMERIVKAQALQDQTQHQFYSPKKTLEINPRHPICKQLLKLVKEDEKSPRAQDIAEMMFETAALQSGFSLDDPSSFASRIIKMMNTNLGLDENSAAEPEPEITTTNEPEEQEQEQDLDAKATRDEL